VKRIFVEWNKTFLVFISCVGLGCGAACAQPAQSRQPQVVRDLRAIRTGNKVTLTWSQPSGLTAMGHLIARICRNISSTDSAAPNSPRACAQPVGEVGIGMALGPVVSTVSEKGDSDLRGRFVDDLSVIPEGPAVLRFAVYAVELTDKRGRTAGFSNSAAVPLAPALPAKGLHFQLDVRGVYLIWENDIENRPASLQFDYRVYRSEKGSVKKLAIPYLHGVIHTRDGDRWSGVDTSIEWEKKYMYWVAPVTRVYAPDGRLISQIEGEKSGPIEVVTHDIFSPAVPERLMVIPSPIHGNRFIDLLWAPNTEKDLAGYNIYRRAENGEAVRINSAPIVMLSFQDTKVAAGAYFYSISAVDVRGNESVKSSEVAQVLR